MRDITASEIIERRSNQRFAPSPEFRQATEMAMMPLVERMIETAQRYKDRWP